MYLSALSAFFELASRTAMNQHILRMPQRCRCLWNVFFLNICLGKHIRRVSCLTSPLPVWHWCKNCHFHENASPYSEMYPKSLWAQRAPYSLYTYCLCHVTGLLFGFKLICLFFFFFLQYVCWHTVNVWLYYSSFPAGNHTSFGIFFLRLSARKPNAGWIIIKHSRHDFSYESYGSFIFIQGSLKYLHVTFHKIFLNHCPWPLNKIIILLFF